MSSKAPEPAARAPGDAPLAAQAATRPSPRGPGADPPAPARAGRGDWFLLGMLLAVALAWLWPEPGARGGALKPELTNKLGVALIFFLHGLMLAFAALRDGLLQVRVHLIVQVTTFVVFPCVGWLLYAALRPSLGEPLAAGVFYLCALPSTVSSSVAMTAAARGNVPAALFNATLSSLLGVVLTPFWVSLVLGASGHALPLGAVVLDLLKWLVLPLCLGQLARPLLGAWAARHKSRLGVIDRLTILLLVYTSFCDSIVSGVWRTSGLRALALTALLAALLLGFALGLTTLACRALGVAPANRSAAIFCGSKKSMAAGVPMARLIFGEHPSLSLLLLPIMLYHSLQLFVAGLLASRFRAAREREPRG